MTKFNIKNACWVKVKAERAKGNLLPPPFCEKCGKKEAPLQAHHDDYRKPLSIRYLCKKCHLIHHHGKGEKKDNQTIKYKISLRKNLLKEIKNPVIIETNGGIGDVYLNCYKKFKGVVFEKNIEKIEILAKQRQDWMVYQCNCINALLGGAGKSFNVNFFDIDPYGACWPIIKAIFENGFYTPSRLAIVANDGFKQKLKMKSAWSTSYLREFVERYGNSELYKNYLIICRELLEKYSSPLNYKIKKWTAYNCGIGGNMTHFAAILER